MVDNDINRIQQNIEQLQDQNAIDFQQWKRLGQEIEKLDEKINISDCNLNLVIKKIKADYESLRRIVIDENIQVQLNNKIDEFSSQLVSIKEQLDLLTNSVKDIKTLGVVYNSSETNSLAQVQELKKKQVKEE